MPPDSRHDSDDTAAIREAVARLCAQFPGDYWRKLDREAGYPTAFVQALTEAGYLAALIPETYGGAGLTLSAAAAILEEIQRAGANGAACHARMYIMGSLLRLGSEAQKALYLPQIASGLAIAGLRRDRTGQRHRHHLDHHLRRKAGRSLRQQQAKGLDQSGGTFRPDAALARTTPKDQVAKRTEGLSVFIIDMKPALAAGMTICPIRTMMNHSTTEVTPA